MKDIQVLRSNAGYYIGTTDEDGLPESHLSEDYFKSAKDAKKASRKEFTILLNGGIKPSWTQFYLEGKLFV